MNITLSHLTIFRRHCCHELQNDVTLFARLIFLKLIREQFAFVTSRNRTKFFIMDRKDGKCFYQSCTLPQNTIQKVSFIFYGRCLPWFVIQQVTWSETIPLIIYTIVTNSAKNNRNGLLWYSVTFQRPCFLSGTHI